MRIKINLSAGEHLSIPIEYNYHLYSNIRNIVLNFLKSYKPKLFNRYQGKLPNFTFSLLMIPKRKIELGFIKMESLYFSFQLTSVDDTFIEYLIKALNSQDSFPIYSHRVQLKKIEILEDIEYSPDMKFKMLSPMCLAERNNKITYFIRPDDEKFNHFFSSHLVQSMNSMNDSNFSSSDIRIILDQDYLERKTNITKLITINNIHYKTIFCPFSLKGNIDIIKFAYHNGIGDHTHYGFGMIEANF